jgi:hypothetical protein
LVKEVWLPTREQPERASIPRRARRAQVRLFGIIDARLTRGQVTTEPSYTINRQTCCPSSSQLGCAALSVTGSRTLQRSTPADGDKSTVARTSGVRYREIDSGGGQTGPIIA